MLIHEIGFDLCAKTFDSARPLKIDTYRLTVCVDSGKDIDMGELEVVTLESAVLIELRRPCTVGTNVRRMAALVCDRRAQADGTAEVKA